jgi:hypothetical protein
LLLPQFYFIFVVMASFDNKVLTAIPIFTENS